MSSSSKKAKKKRRSNKDIIPLEMVFKPDPHGDQEDMRPVELRKGRNKPNRSIPWEVIKYD